MAKWLAGAGIAILAVLFFMWRQLDASDAAPAAPVKPTPAVAVSASPSTPPPAKIVEPDAAEEAPVDDKPKKLEVESDAFFYQFQEVVPKRLTAQAAQCYEGIAKRVHRNQKLSLKFKMKIKDGKVTVNDVTIKENTLNNPGLESCFIQEVARVSWTDDTLPDWEAEDELVLRPERGMKKFMRDNIEYVGAPAPRD